MAKEKQSSEELINTLKDRGLSCAKLKSMEKKQFTDAKNFRASGFVNIAKLEEETARKIRGLRKKVCLLR